MAMLRAWGQPPGASYAPPAPQSQTLRYPVTQSPAGPAPGVPTASQPQQDLSRPVVLMARVGDKVIYNFDVEPGVNLILDPYLANAKSETERAEIEANREALARNVVRQMVQNKLLFLEFEREFRKHSKAD